MLKRFSKSVLATIFLFVVLCTAREALAITAYGVNAAGTLFSFDVAAPASVTTIGSVSAGGGIVFPEAIDFRPGTSTLYAIDVGGTTTQLYTINIGTGAATPVGAGFASVGAGYSLSPNDSIGFDFNPTTLQGDGSMRIRLVATNNTNLRLNSSTGLIAATDTALAFANGNSPFIDGAAYINNVVGSTVTQLFDMDSRNNALLLQNPPNPGTVATIGSFGFSIDALAGIGFDIYTDPASTDTTTVGDFGFAVFERPDAPANSPAPLGSYLLYSVNLTTGATTNGALVGPAATPFSFEGGFAVLPVPEPATVLLALVGAAGLWIRRR